MTMFKNAENLLTSLRDGINKLVYGKQIVGQETLVISTSNFIMGTVQLSAIPPNAVSAEITNLWYNVTNSASLQANSVRYYYEIPLPSTANSATYNIQSATISGGTIIVIFTTVPHNYTNGQIVKMQGIANNGAATGWQLLNSIPYAIRVESSTSFSVAMATAPTLTSTVIGATVSLANSSSTSSGGYSWTGTSTVFNGGGILRDNSPYPLIVYGKDSLKSIRFQTTLAENRAISVIYYS